MNPEIEDYLAAAAVDNGDAVDHISDYIAGLEVKLAHADRRIRFLRHMIEEAKANIGVPGESYAAPIAYAYVLLDKALKSDAEDVLP